jgi:hypothetical protein
MVALLIIGFAGYTGFLGFVLEKISPETANSSTQTPFPDGRSLRGVKFLGSSATLDEQSFAGTNVGGLSAITYDPTRDLYYSLVDREQRTFSRFYTLSLPLEQGKLGEPKVFDVTTLYDFEDKELGGGEIDGEGIAITNGGEIFVASEYGPSIHRFSLDGRMLAKPPVPQKFLVGPKGEGQENAAFEGLTLSPGGPSMFAITQEPLSSDGEDPEGRKRIRLLRYENRGTNGYGYQPSKEYFYLSEPNRAVGDIAAISENDLLILEHDNRIYRVSLAGAENVSGEQNLSKSGLEPIEKEPLVNVNACPLGDDSQPANYEGLALGPALPDGSQTLILQSDDGFESSRTTRMVALSANLRHPHPDPKPEACE